MTRDWMAELAAHVARMQAQYPDEPLMVMFDIDGTILDMRYLIYELLQEYDREHQTNFFARLQRTEIDVHENRIGEFLLQLDIPPVVQEEIETWYFDRYWTTDAIHLYHRPFPQVFDVIRWLQMQPQITVGLNTGRLDAQRADTLSSLNALGRDYRVHFASALLFMRPDDWPDSVAESKVAGLHWYQEQGYRIIAMLDNEPSNLDALAAADTADEILLLHADTIFISEDTHLPPTTIQGETYDLTQLITEEQLPPAVQLVWHGVNDRINLARYLSSSIEWPELDVNLDPAEQTLILRHDSFAELPATENEHYLPLDEALVRLRERNRAVKLDFKVGGPWIEETLDLVDKHNFDPAQLWFNANLELWGEAWVRRLARAYPGAIVQSPIGFLAPQIGQPDAMKTRLEEVVSWGINRFSVPWHLAEARELVIQLLDWDFAVNIYGVTDLTSFLQAVLLQPHAVTCDFNFPEWGYYGRGSGRRGFYYTYPAATEPATQSQAVTGDELLAAGC